MVVAKFRAWMLPVVFLAGYLVGWGNVLVDRQMVIASQAELARELATAKQQLRSYEIMETFDFDWQRMVIWNKEAILPPVKEVGR